MGKDEVGPAASLYIAGYRIALLVSGALALILADHLPWRTVYLLMAATMTIGILATLFAPEPKTPGTPPQSIAEAVMLPFMEYFHRKGRLVGRTLPDLWLRSGNDRAIFPIIFGNGSSGGSIVY